MRFSRVSTGVKIIVGFSLGIAIGAFFGEGASVLKPLGTAYIRLLQMAIVPYITVSLVYGLGRLTPSQAGRLAASAGIVFLGMISIGLLMAMLAPLAFPDWEAATYFSSSLLRESSSIDFVSLYITANPFEALANTIVPAIVIFSIVMGVAVMLSAKKAPLLQFLASVEDALMIISRFVVRLAPLGIFAIAANAAGTLDLSDLDRLQVYVWVYLVLWALLFFVILPGLLVALTPIRYGEFFLAFRAPFITAFATGSVLIVLPMLIEEIRKLLETHGAADEETAASVDVLIPTLFNFPSVAMMLVLSFVFFAGWYSGSELTLDQYPLFATAGFFVAFGGSNVALPFLLDLFRLPVDLFDLFLVANVINNFFFMALAAINIVVCTLLTMMLIRRRLAARPLHLAVLLAALVVAAPVLLAGTGAALDRAIAHEYRGYAEFVDRDLLYDRVVTSERQYDPRLPALGRSQPRIDRIKETGLLRLGYSPDSLPWMFHNSAGDVVGFDMELINRLALGFGVGLELVRVDMDRVTHALESGQIDIYASGLLMEPRRAGEFAFSVPYEEVTLGMLVRDHQRREFEASGRFTGAGTGTVGVLNAPSLLRGMEIRAPDRQAVPVDSARAFITGDEKQLVALVMPAEAASAWTFVYPEFSVVVPEKNRIRIPLVFGLPESDPEFLTFVNHWIDSSRSLGIMDRAYEYWILGQSAETRQPRWSIIRDVLGWLD